MLSTFTDFRLKATKRIESLSPEWYAYMKLRIGLSLNRFIIHVHSAGFRSELISIPPS